MNVPARGCADGKVILLGEHAVVYGRPAVAASLPVGITVDVRRGAGPALSTDLPQLATDPRPTRLLIAAAELVGIDAREVVAEVRSTLPPGAGLGSSAALTIAMLRAVAGAAERFLSFPDELAFGRQLEAIFHGQSSGIDPAAAALGGCFEFHRGEPPRVTPLRPPRVLPLVIAWGGSPRSTGATVGALRERWTVAREHYERLFDQVAVVVARGVRAIADGDVAALGAAFDANQALLEELGVSTPEVEGLVTMARGAGALGAKLTGGGGGGAVVALAEDPSPVVAALARAGFKTLVTGIGGRVEEAA